MVPQEWCWISACALVEILKGLSGGLSGWRRRDSFLLLTTLEDLTAELVGTIYRCLWQI